VRTIKTKPSLRDTLEANQKALEGLCRLAGKEPPPRQTILGPKRASPKPTGEPLESDVIRAVSDVLAKHPKVLFAVRQNSGMASNANGAPIWFYRWCRARTGLRISDFWGMTTDGRMFAFEAKRPGWTKPVGQREIEQRDFLLTVKYAGGIGEFVTDVQHVLDALNA
jgi:hypothetical protein